MIRCVRWTQANPRKQGNSITSTSERESTAKLRGDAGEYKDGQRMETWNQKIFAYLQWFAKRSGIHKGRANKAGSSKEGPDGQYWLSKDLPQACCRKMWSYFSRKPCWCCLSSLSSPQIQFWPSACFSLINNIIQIFPFPSLYLRRWPGVQVATENPKLQQPCHCWGCSRRWFSLPHPFLPPQIRSPWPTRRQCNLFDFPRPGKRCANRAALLTPARP